MISTLIVQHRNGENLPFPPQSLVVKKGDFDRGNDLLNLKTVSLGEAEPNVRQTLLFVVLEALGNPMEFVLFSLPVSLLWVPARPKEVRVRGRKRSLVLINQDMPYWCCNNLTHPRTRQK